MSYNFISGENLLEICEKNKMTIYEVCIKRENELTGVKREEIINKMAHSLDIMKNAISLAKTKDIKSMGGLIGGQNKKFTAQQCWSRKRHTTKSTSQIKLHAHRK